MTVKEYLQQVRYYDEVIEEKFAEIDKLRALAIKVNNATDGDRVKSSPSLDKFSDIVSGIVDIQMELKDDIKAFITLKTNILDMINKLTDGRMVQVLYKRYFNYMTFEAIADELHISRRWVTTIHNRALKKLSKYMSS